VSGRVAVIGAGVAGLTAGYQLSREGHLVHVYERWPGLGGQAATLPVGDGVLLERYYHHLFTSDLDIAGLYRELGLPDGIEWLPSSVGFHTGGRTHPFTSPLDLLRFPPLSLRSRLRMGLGVLRLRRHEEAGPFERVTARQWIARHMGEESWERVWGPLLGNKFGERAEEISMAWLWSKLTVRGTGKEAKGEVLGYPRDTFEGLFQALGRAIEEREGQVLIDRPAARIEARAERFAVLAGAPDSFRRGHDPRDFEVSGAPEEYDAVIATVPNAVFEQLLEPGLAARLAPGYLERLRSIEYHAAVCLLLELDRDFGRFYWTNVGDSELPFVGLIEQTKLVDPSRYGGRRFLYVANYVAHGDPLLELDADQLLDHYEPGLRRVNPEFDRSWVRNRWLHREPDAQPIVTAGYRDRMPALETGLRGLFLANTTQVYPEDRGTNYAVRLGRQVAGLARMG
jgi:protoporphyrinogen oxidase